MSQKVASNDAVAELIKWFILKKHTLKIYETILMRFPINSEMCVTLRVGCNSNTAGKVVTLLGLQIDNFMYFPLPMNTCSHNFHCRQTR